MHDLHVLRLAPSLPHSAQAQWTVIIHAHQRSARLAYAWVELSTPNPMRIDVKHQLEAGHPTIHHLFAVAQLDTPYDDDIHIVHHRRRPSR
jgi:hypothetical protein